MNVEKLPILVITAPSCAGKDYLTNCLFKRHPGVFSMVVSTTTRPPRSGEVNGVDYNFVSESEFNNLEEESKLLESVRFGNKCYGTSLDSIQEIQSKGQFPVLIVEPTGAKNIKNWCESNNQPASFVYLKVDRELALDRFLNRFISDYSDIELDIPNKIEESSQFNRRFSDLVDNYTKRIFISMYQENDWEERLTYDYKFGPMINPSDTESVVDLLAKAFKDKEAPPWKVPQGLDKVFEKSHRPPPSEDMSYVIKKTLIYAKDHQVTAGYLKGIILESEKERLNQKTFNFKV